MEKYRFNSITDILIRRIAKLRAQNSGDLHFFSPQAREI